MKKIILSILILATLLCGCQRTAPQNEETTHTETEAVVDRPEEDDDYQSITRRSPTSYTDHQFGIRNGNLMLELDLPSEWTVRSDEAGLFSITADEKTVGSILFGALADTEGWKVVETDDSKVTDLKMTMFIEKRGTGETLEFRYRFVYEYTDNDAKCTVNLLVDCAEVNTFTQKRLLLAPAVYPLRSDGGIGTLKNVKKDRILILGNSFVNSSGIGSILREMLRENGKSANVQAISRGYATVNTYISDESMMEQIRSGSFDVIFICGFYSSSEIVHLKTLKAACDQSNTTLVIFPAHNESENVFNQACKETSLPSLNWKGEINALIKTGISKWEFCIDDMHQHSTVSAGYVGAHMIYRALYGTIPTKPLSTSIDQDYINRLLGDYVQTGTIPLRDASAMKYFD